MPQEISQENLQQVLQNIYNKLRIQFSRIDDEEDSDGDDLTSVEKASMEAIAALGEPRVAEFAKFMHISAPNAAYRVASLVKKGYLKKNQSKKDQRQYFLRPTAKYVKYQDKNRSYISELAGEIENYFSKENFDRLVEMLTDIDEKIMTRESMIGKGGNSDATGKGTEAE